MMIVLEGEIFVSWLDYEGRTHVSEISSFIKEAQKTSQLPSVLCGHIQRATCKKADPHQTVSQLVP